MPRSDHRPAPMLPRYLTIGEVLRPHGVRGELLLRLMTEYPERIGTLKTVYLGLPGETPAPYTVAGARMHRGKLLLKLAEVPDRTSAEKYRGYLVQISLGDAPPLEEDEYYLFQVLGVEVITTDGDVLGRVTDVLETGANDVFVVRGGPKGEVLIPDVPHVVVELDVEGRQMIVKLMDGLLPD